MSKSFICCLSFFLSACLLVQEEDNFLHVSRDPDPNRWSHIEYSYTGNRYDVLADTVYMDDAVYFKLNRTEVADFEVSVNDEVIVPFGSDHRFQIAKDDRPDGYYKLTFKEHVPSGTGSLADRSGVEFAEFRANYVLAIGEDNFTPRITDIRIEDGTLKIEWEKYSRGDFESYEVMRYYTAGGFFNRTFKIEDQNQTSFGDESYAGGSQKYAIRVNRGGEALTSALFSFSYRFNPQFELERISSTQLRLYLKNRPDTYNNIRFYSILMDGYVVKDKIIPEGFAYLDFNIAHPPLYFGDERSYGIRLQGQVDLPNEYTSDLHTASVRMCYGKKIPPISDVIFSSSANVFYLNSRGMRIYKVDGEDYAILDSAVVGDAPTNLNHTMVMSANRQYLLFMKGPMISEIDVEDLETVHTYDLTDFGIAAGSVLDAALYQTFAVTDNRLALFKVKGGDVITVDLDSKQQVYAAPANGAFDLSSDGKYIVNGDELLSYNGTGYALKASLPFPEITYSQFLHSDPAKLFIQTPDAIYLYDCETLAVRYFMALSTYPTYESRPYLDQHTGKFFVDTDGNSVPFERYKYIDIGTGEVKDMNLYFAAQFAIEGGILFSKDGYVLTDY